MLKKIVAALLALFAAAAFAAVDVNKASQADLDGVKGIGPAIAGKIVDARKAGPFKDWQDFIDRVKGVGEGNAAKFSAEGLTVNGASFAGAPAKAADAKPAKAKAEAKAADAKADAKTETKADTKKAKAEAAAAADEGASKAKKGKKKAKDAADAADAAASKAKK